MKIGSGATPRGGDAVYVSDGVSLIRSQNVYNGRFRFEGLAHIGKEHAEQLNGVSVNPGDILLNITGDSVARACRVPPEILPARVNQHVAIVRPDPLQLDARFLLYLFISPAMQQNLLGLAAAGATRKALTKATIEELALPSVPLAEQRRIAGVLGALDNKIEHNRALIQRLVTLTEACAAHLLSEAQTERPLSRVARFVNGKAFTKHGNGRGRPILRIKELNGGITAATLSSDIGADDENVAHTDSLLFAWSGSLDVYRWDGPEALINQHIFKVIPNREFPSWLVEHWVRSHLPEFRAIAGEKATTMGHIQRHHLDEAIVRVPSRRDLDEVRLAIDPSERLRAALASESRRLVVARDALLPRLLSRQTCVSEEYEPCEVKSAT